MSFNMRTTSLTHILDTLSPTTTILPTSPTSSPESPSSSDETIPLISPRSRATVADPNSLPDRKCAPLVSILTPKTSHTKTLASPNNALVSPRHRKKATITYASTIHSLNSSSSSSSEKKLERLSTLTPPQTPHRRTRLAAGADTPPKRTITSPELSYSPSTPTPFPPPPSSPSSYEISPADPKTFLSPECASARRRKRWQELSTSNIDEAAMLEAAMTLAEKEHKRVTKRHCAMVEQRGDHSADDVIPRLTLADQAAELIRTIPGITHVTVHEKTPDGKKTERKLDLTNCSAALFNPATESKEIKSELTPEHIIREKLLSQLEKILQAQFQQEIKENNILRPFADFMVEINKARNSDPTHIITMARRMYGDVIANELKATYQYELELIALGTATVELPSPS